jgi:cytidylate kinase
VAVVTISRQYGSGGTEIGERVCELLGYRYVDKLLMTQVAASVGLLNQEVVDCSEEHFKVNNFLERLLFPGPHRFAQFSIRSTDVEATEPMALIQLDDARCANLVHQAIHTAYKQGDVVIVGRGGQVTLRDRPDVLHIRVEAPIQYRILRIQKMEGVGPDEARSLAKRHDQVSAQYLRTLFNIKWDDLALYHMAINSGKLDLEDAAQLVANAVQRIGASPAD